MQRNLPVVLTIAGSDSGGGAGIQADLKTFAALGTFGTSALTAVTAQNTVGVRRVDALEPRAVVAQIEAVEDDFEIAAVKIGMLANAGIVEVVADLIESRSLVNVVLDPVMVAGSGDPLLEADAIAALLERLLPLATVLTPNVPEAALMVGRELEDRDEDLTRAATELRARGVSAVLLKGGHRKGDADDILVTESGVTVLEAERIAGAFTHGTGCTLSSAIAAYLARGHSLEDSARGAKEYVTQAIAGGVQLGQGQANLHHFWEYYGREGLP